MHLKPIWLLGLLFVLSLTLGACQVRAKTSSVGVVGYNHTDTDIYEVLLNGSGGGSVFAHSGGGSTVCCVLIPDTWQPGLEVQVEWSSDLKTYKRQVVAVPTYDAKAARMAVHFLRSGEVKIFVTSLSLGHPDYPLTGPEAGLNEERIPFGSNGGIGEAAIQPAN